MSTEIAATTEELPEQLYLPPSRARWVVAAVISTALVGLDLYVAVAQNAQAAWLLVVLFGMLGIFAGVQLIPGSAGLWLDRSGFIYRLFWIDRRRQWNEVTPILPSQVGLLQMVGYNRKDDPPNKPREVLPDTYGISANELADIMNHWRDTALKGA